MYSVSEATARVNVHGFGNWPLPKAIEQSKLVCLASSDQPPLPVALSLVTVAQNVHDGYLSKEVAAVEAALEDMANASPCTAALTLSPLAPSPSQLEHLQRFVKPSTQYEMLALAAKLPLTAKAVHHHPLGVGSQKSVDFTLVCTGGSCVGMFNGPWCLAAAKFVTNYEEGETSGMHKDNEPAHAVIEARPTAGAHIPWLCWFCYYIIVTRRRAQYRQSSFTTFVTETMLWQNVAERAAVAHAVINLGTFETQPIIQRFKAELVTDDTGEPLVDAKTGEACLRGGKEIVVRPDRPTFTACIKVIDASCPAFKLVSGKQELYARLQGVDLHGEQVDAGVATNSLTHSDVDRSAEWLLVVVAPDGAAAREYASVMKCRNERMRNRSETLPPVPTQELTKWQTKSWFGVHIDYGAHALDSAPVAANIRRGLMGTTPPTEATPPPNQAWRVEPGDNDVCMGCKRADWWKGNELIQCESCEGWIHVGCDPRITGVPQGSYSCPKCQQLAPTEFQLQVVPSTTSGIEEASAGGRAGEFIGEEAVQELMLQKDLMTAIRDSKNPSREHAFPIIPDSVARDPSISIARIGVLRASPKQKQGGGLPTIYQSTYPTRRHEVVGGGEVKNRADAAPDLKAMLRRAARSRLYYLLISRACGGSNDEWTSMGSLFNGKSQKTRHAFGAEDAHIAAQRQAGLGMALSTDFNDAVEKSCYVRISVNDESSALHVDACKHGLMTIVDLLHYQVAEKPRKERHTIRRDDSVHPCEGCILAPELGAHTWLETGKDMMHGMWNEILHGSLRVGGEQRRLRGRGNHTSTYLLGNGLGRLLKAVGAWPLWVADGAPEYAYPHGKK